MFGRVWDRFHDWLYRPRLDWIQVEINTDCNARCIYCPSTVWKADWPRRRMSLETFERLLPHLARSAETSSWRQPFLHLQGWGEPFVNRDFFAMLDAAKRAGCRVGTTSNATRLDDATAKRLVDSGIDTVSLSVAGIDARNDAVRRGTSLERVFDALAALERHKRAAGSDTPVVNIAYMLLRSGLDDIERIPEPFARRGVSGIVVSTLYFVPDPSLADEAILPATEEAYQAVCGRLAAAATRAGELGMELHFRIPRPGRPPGLCTENVQAALVVTVDGEVTPCMLGAFVGGGRPDGDGSPLTFGDLTRDSLADIWWKDSYVQFRRSFWDGTPPARCLDCAKLGQS